MTAVDQITKLFVRFNMQVGDSHTVWDGILRFTFYQNSGAARSSFQGYGRLFGIAAVIFIALVIYYRRQNRGERRLMDIGLAFLVAGAAGNGIERLLFGKVTDFLQFGSGDGILNIADLCINVGLLAVIVQQLFFSRGAKNKQAVS
ncbi:signal peptidase II [Paenibacillus sp. T1]|uniref:Lipoprotein signal peptidase n=2 Tax=Paenibacillus glycinis TaxID=2697035 RepID=A0ABW9XZS8_9BACL|nr:signal peptidase II [Paenibacillus glycinis]